MSDKPTIKNIQKLVSQNEIKQALEQLQVYLQKENPQLEYQAILIAATHRQIKEKTLTGVLSNAEQLVLLNTLRKNILDLLSNSISSNQENNSTSRKSNTEQKAKNIININRNSGDIHIS